VSAVRASIDLAVNGLRARSPEMSAYRTLSPRQAQALGATATAILIALVLAPVSTVIALNALSTIVYLAALIYAIRWFRAVLREVPLVRISDDEARSIPDAELPRYTVLVAAYREGAVIKQTIASLHHLDYPPDRLEIMLLLEADDASTIAAAKGADLLDRIEIVEVPYARPRTKPKACNIGLQLASGELLTIFDAEDRPEPLQLRRAAVAFSRLDRTVGCLQAKLHYHNADQNLLTRLFAAEYVTWFARLLPALVSLGAPIPLGGTSMHIRRSVLEEVGGWDSYNVTEDADLGIRLRRFGYRTEILDSVTQEEANSDFINWVKQRSRWYKGYLQTWLVHMRDPKRLWRELGPSGFIGFNMVVGATPVLALLNPAFWLLALLWFAGRLEVVQTLFPGWVFYPAMLCAAIGNFLAIYRSMISLRAAGYPHLIFAALIAPAYWIMMSVAAVRAFAQLVIAPWHWEKTVHGLDQPVHQAVRP
jgi:cellulose synthase/poly-beta-1,6-N-acetylglucosamine synthase-like glycosyltransferase